MSSPTPSGDGEQCAAGECKPRWPLLYPLARGLPIVCAMAVLTKFAKDFRRSATLDAKSAFFGSYAHAAAACSYFDTASVVVFVVSAPLCACLSDTVGRKPLLIAEALVTALPHLFLYLRLPLWWYLAADDLVPDASCVTYAFVADITHPLSLADRALCFGLLEAAHSLGSLLGYGLHSLLASGISASTSFLVSTIAGLVAVGLATCLPESLALQCRTPFFWRQANPLGAFRFIHRHRKTLGLLFFIYSLFEFQDIGQDSIVDMYNADQFSIRHALFDRYWIFVHLVEGLAAVGLVKGVTDLWANTGLLLAGALLSFVGYLLLILGSGVAVAFTSGALIAAGAVWEPGMLAIIVGAVPPDQEGLVQGALAALMSFCTFGSPIIFGNLFDLTEKSFPACVWVMASMVTALAGLLAMLHSSLKPVALPNSHLAADHATEDGSVGEEDAASEGEEDRRGTCWDSGAFWIGLLALSALLNAAVGLVLSLSS